MRSEGELLRAESVVEVQRRGDTTELRMVLREGKKRQIRRMMDAVGHPVKRLVRLAVGQVELGRLRTAQWRHLTHEEVSKLIDFV